MSPLVHRVYIALLVAIVVCVALFLFYKGHSYYSLPVEERFYHPDHNDFKPSGAYGHGLGIVGTLLIIIGVFGYQAKKKYRALARFGRLKYWLEFHIFLCTLGPVMILFHTAFKFGGLVSVSFWSMVAVVASGVAGRFIYIQIPRTVEGRELSIHELQEMKIDLDATLKKQYHLDEQSCQAVALALSQDAPVQGSNFVSAWLSRSAQARSARRNIQEILTRAGLPHTDVAGVVRLLNKEITLNYRIAWLQTMRRLFKYWHVAHLPFALIMLVIMVIHVAITLAFGYRWIF